MTPTPIIIHEAVAVFITDPHYYKRFLRWAEIVRETKNSVWVQWHQPMGITRFTKSQPDNEFQTEGQRLDYAQEYGTKYMNDSYLVLRSEAFLRRRGEDHEAGFLPDIDLPPFVGDEYKVT